MTRIMCQWWWTKQTWTSEFHDYHIRLWNTRKVPALDNWFRKFRTIQIDMLFNKIYDRINHFILCPESEQMIRDVGNIESCELLETEPKTQCTVCLSYWNIGILYCTCGHFLHKERGAKQQFISKTMDLLSLPEYVIKKRRPHGHRYGKKPGNREYFTAHKLEQRCKKKHFQGIHDRIKRDPEFRSRMIENHRDEELCRRRDALADEDHTHHLTAQEYSLYQRNLWLHSNKQGSNTVRLSQRPDFKQALSTLHRLQREAEGDPQVPTYSDRSQQWAQSSSSRCRNWQGSWWTPYPSESHDGDARSTERTGDLLNWSIGKDSSGQDFLEFNLLCYRWIVYSWRRPAVTDGWCKHNTSNDPFSRCKTVQVCSKWLQERIDDHNIQSGYKCTIRLKVQKWKFNIGMLCLRGDIARLHDRHQWRPDNHDCLPHRAHQHEHVSA